MNSDPQLDASLGRQSGVTLAHPILNLDLNLDRAADGVNDAAEFD
jgi:hypothetical protein